MRDRSTTTRNQNSPSRGFARERRERCVHACSQRPDVARPSRVAIVGRPSTPSSLFASLRPFGLAGLTASHGRLGTALT